MSTYGFEKKAPKYLDMVNQIFDFFKFLTGLKAFT